MRTSVCTYCTFFCLYVPNKIVHLSYFAEIFGDTTCVPRMATQKQSIPGYEMCKKKNAQPQLSKISTYEIKLSGKVEEIIFFSSLYSRTSSIDRQTPDLSFFPRSLYPRERRLRGA